MRSAICVNAVPAAHPAAVQRVQPVAQFADSLAGLASSAATITTNSAKTSCGVVAASDSSTSHTTIAAGWSALIRSAADFSLPPSEPIGPLDA